MQNPTGGRHRRPRLSMTSRLWWLFASAVAWSIAQVIGAPHRSEPRARPRPQLPAAPRRPQLYPPPGTPPRPLSDGPWVHPDELAGALVRPYTFTIQPLHPSWHP